MEKLLAVYLETRMAMKTLKQITNTISKSTVLQS